MSKSILRFSLVTALLFVASSCEQAALTAPSPSPELAVTATVNPAFDLAPVPQVFTSGANVRTWDAIIPSAAYANWETSICKTQPLIGLDANWQNEHNAFVLTGHPWANDYFIAPWINAWNTLASVGPSGHNWTKYRTQVQGNGSFVIRLLADNCSWVYLDRTLVGVQGTNLAANSYGLTLNGTHTLEFIIFDGGGAAGGKFRLETTTTPPPPLNPDLDGDGCLNELDAFPLDPTRCSADNTPPEITPTITGPLGQNGWYTGNVNLTWSVVDNGSPITSAPCPAVTVVNNTAGITFTCTATSAGGTASRSVTIKRDNTPPVITETITGTPGDNGWYVSTVNVTFSISDDVSNVPSPNCPVPAVDFDTPGQDRFCTATNFAGLNATKTVTIKRDTQRPAINFALTGVQGMNGWFVTDAGVTWLIAETVSGIASAIGCTPYNQTTDTPGVSLSCTVKDNAGNAQTRPFLLKRDASDPTIEKAVTGTLGDNDWFITDMTLTWTVAPHGPSGLISPPCPSQSVTANTPGIMFLCFAQSGAGKKVQGQANIKRDVNSPTVNAVPSGTMGANGWFTSDVTVGWMVIPNGPSGASAAGCNVTTINTDTPGTTVDCIAKSGAGVSGNGSITVKRDASTPTITPHLTGSPGDNGWFTSNVDVSWSVSDNGPSGAAATCNVSTVTADTPGEIVKCTATTGAGLPATEVVTVKKDASSPSVSSSLNGDLGNNGWYTSDVDVSWQTSANGPSGVSAPCATQTLSNNTPGATFECNAKSGAGTETPGLVTVKRDATMPEIAYAGNAGTYTVDQTVSISCAASDALSGLALNTCAPVTGPAYSFGTGATFTANATDKAGNANSASTTFTVKATSASLCALTKLFVTGPGEAGIENSMCTKLEKGSYAPYINEVRAQSGKSITAANSSILIRIASSM